MKKMKKIISMSTLILGCCSLQNIEAQSYPPIPANYFGINYWMPYNYNITPAGQTAPYPKGVTDFPNIEALIEGAGATFFRIGGNGYDKYGITNGANGGNNDYIKAIAAVKLVNPNAKFLIQIPFKANVSYTWVHDLVSNIKLAYPLPSDIFYYSIGNEWDHYLNPNGTKTYNSQQIASNIKNYAAEIKEADKTCRIVGPSLTNFYGTDNAGQYIIQRLIGGGTQGEDITGLISGSYPDLNGAYYYIDVVDFHTYPIGNYGDMTNRDVNGNPLNTQMSPANYNLWLSKGIASPNDAINGFAHDLSNTTLFPGFDGLQLLINKANIHRTSPLSPLTFAITEMNICWSNPWLSSQTSISPYENTINGIGTRSFFAGQYLVDMFSSILKNGGNKPEFVMPWSIWEHSGDGFFTDLGMTKGAASSIVTPTPLPTYYHYEMMADNFKCLTNFSAGTTNTALKAFGGFSANTKYTVMILNQTTRDVACALMLGSDISGGNYITMSFPGNFPKILMNINVVANSTMVLVFNGSAELTNKIEYKQSDGSSGKPIYTIYNPAGGNVVSAELGPEVTPCLNSSYTLRSNPFISGATYKWYSGPYYSTLLYSSSSTNTFNVTSANTYKVVVNYGGCTAEDYIKVNACQFCCPRALILESSTTPSVSSELLDNVPNPSDGNTTIYYNLAPEATKGIIQITDIYGKLIEEIPVSTDNNSVAFNCNNCANGIYFYSLIVGEKKIGTKKIVIAK